MKYIIIFICVFFQSSAFAQKDTIPEFYLGDPQNTKKSEFAISSSSLENIIFSEGLAAVKIIDTLHGGYTRKIGFINKKGKLIISAKYDTLVSQFQTGVYKIKFAIVGFQDKGNGDMCLGVIDEKDKVLINFSLEEVGSLKSNKVPVKYQNGYSSFIHISSSYEFIREYKIYKSIEYFPEFFKVQNFSKWKIFNIKSDTTYFFADTLISIYKDTYKFSRNNKFGIVTYNQGWHIDSIITDTNFVINNKNVSQKKIDQRFIKIKEKDKYGILNKDGKIIVPAEYDSIYVSSEDSVFVVYKGKKMGIIDHDGSVLLEMNERYEAFLGFVEGRARIIKSGKFGYIDRRGNVRIAPQYLKAEDFSEGAAAVIINGKWGFVDKDENIVVQPYYTEVKSFRNGMACVREGSKWYFVNKAGKKLNTSYDGMQVADYDKWLLVKNNKYGLADKNGRELIVPRYDLVEDLESGFVKVKKDGKYGVLDYEGNFVVPIEHDGLIYNPSQKIFLVMIKGLEEIIEIK